MVGIGKQKGWFVKMNTFLGRLWTGVRWIVTGRSVARTARWKERSLGIHALDLGSVDVPNVQVVDDPTAPSGRYLVVNGDVEIPFNFVPKKDE